MTNSDAANPDKEIIKDDSKRVLVAQAPTALMNPTLDPDVIKQAYDEDPVSAKAEYGEQLRTDVESYISRETEEVAVIPDRIELPSASNNYYIAFVDPAGGSGQDAMTCAIAHKDKKTNRIIVDAFRVKRPPFSPDAVFQEFCDLFDSYRVREINGDHLAGNFVREQFRKKGIGYKVSKKTKSDLYSELLPLINSQRVELPDSRQLFNELTNLERGTSISGKDSIDHAPGSHDDLVNSVAGAIVFTNSKRITTCVPQFRMFN